jgi:hypothetical protein
VFDKRISVPRFGKRGYKRIVAVNQRVKSVIETSKKIKLDWMAIEREKALRPSGRPLGRIGI